MLTPLTVPGVHAIAWNSFSLGVEMLGDYDYDDFNSGRGAVVQANSIAAVAILSNFFGFEPGSLKLHREDHRTTHHCPGDGVDKEAFIQAVREYPV